MPIDRTPFNALIDDDGSGTTGTPWNKAQIAGVILDPTDVVLATIPNLSALGQNIIFTGDYGLARSVATGQARIFGGTGIGTGAIIAAFGNSNGTNPGGIDQQFGSGSSYYRLKNSSSSDLQTIDGNGAAQFNSSIDIAWTFNSTHVNGAVIRTSNNGTQNMFLGARAATGTGSASDGVFGCQGNLYIWPQAGYLVPHSDATYSLGNTSHRWAVVYAASGTINTSDGRQKTDIAATDRGLAFVEALRPVRYRWRTGNDTQRVHYGLVAQDLLTLGANDFVYGNDTDGYGTNYAAFTAPVIAAIQELAARVRALEEGNRP